MQDEKTTELEHMMLKDEILKTLRISAQSWDKKVLTGKAPQPKKFGQRSFRWIESDIIEYINNPDPEYWIERNAEKKIENIGENIQNSVFEVLKLKGKHIRNILEDKDLCEILAKEFENFYSNYAKSDINLHIKLNLEMKPFKPMYNAQSFTVILDVAPERYLKKFFNGNFQIPYCLDFEVYKDGKAVFDHGGESFNSRLFNLYAK